jgi:hypothetical protein
MTLTEQIAAIVAAADFGKPTAVKRGRNPAWPYVPIVDHGRHTEQLLALAFVTRAEAIAAASATIQARRDHLARQLAEPRMRALRQSHGLPREI